VSFADGVRIQRLLKAADAAADAVGPLDEVGCLRWIQMAAPSAAISIERTSPFDAAEMRRYCMNSASRRRRNPSAMLFMIESTA